MYLKRLDLQGFKSFPDKVKLEFNPGISSLRRTRSGGFTVENAWDLEDFLEKLQNSETK